MWKLLEFVAYTGGTQNKDICRLPTTKQVTPRMSSDTKQSGIQSELSILISVVALWQPNRKRHQRPPAPKSVPAAMRERRWWFLLAFAISASLLGYRHTLQWCGPLTRHHGRELVVRHAKDEISKRLGRVSTPRRRESMESQEDWDYLAMSWSNSPDFYFCVVCTGKLNCNL